MCTLLGFDHALALGAHQVGGQHASGVPSRMSSFKFIQGLSIVHCYHVINGSMIAWSAQVLPLQFMLHGIIHRVSIDLNTSQSTLRWLLLDCIYRALVSKVWILKGVCPQIFARQLRLIQPMLEI